jgi:hypothetical protein
LTLPAGDTPAGIFILEDWILSVALSGQDDGYPAITCRQR